MTVVVVMPDLEALLQLLLNSPRLMAAQRKQVERAQGVYVWWLVDQPTTCLKVGRAFLGTRKEGLRRRIRHHFSSNEHSSVLARHIAMDKTSPWCVDAGLQERDARKGFLATNCCFQALPLPDRTEKLVEELEGYLELKLKPRYIGEVGGGGS